MTIILINKLICTYVFPKCSAILAIAKSNYFHFAKEYHTFTFGHDNVQTEQQNVEISNK